VKKRRWREVSPDRAIDLRVTQVKACRKGMVTFQRRVGIGQLQSPLPGATLPALVLPLPGFERAAWPSELNRTTLLPYYERGPPTSATPGSFSG